MYGIGLHTLYLYIYLSLSISIYLSIYPSIYPSAYSTICIYIHTHVYIHIYIYRICISISICICIYNISIYLPIPSPSAQGVVLFAIGIFSSFITQITTTMSSLRLARTEQHLGAERSNGGDGDWWLTVIDDLNQQFAIENWWKLPIYGWLTQ